MHANLKGFTMNFANLILCLIAMVFCDCCLACAQEKKDEFEWTKFEIVIIAELVNDNKLCEQLKILQSQRSKLIDIKSNLMTKHASMNSIGYREKFEDSTIQKMQQDLFQQTVEQIEELFVPSQLDRLREVSRQKRYRAFGLDFGLLNRQLMDNLKIDAQQLEEIKARSFEHEKLVAAKLSEFEKELNNLREKHQKELLSVLTEEQRKEYDRLLGKIHFQKIKIPD